MLNNVKNISFDRELSQGAFNAINICLRLKREERITIITDHENLEIAFSLVHEIEKIGSEYRIFVLEEITQRPLKNMPQVILADLAKSQVSIFCCNSQTGELSSRIQMVSVVNENKLRHGHMVNINKQIMLEGMRADFLEIDRQSQILVEKARKAKTISATSKSGTNILAEFSTDLKWIKTSGIITTDKWGNLPGGEIFTSPKTVNGLFVVDGVVGEIIFARNMEIWFETPLYIEIVDNPIKHIECSNKELLDEFTAYTMTDENSNRVGEFAMGTNTAVAKILWAYSAR